MTIYRKKPVAIEAKKATGTPDSNREIIDWTRGSSTPAFMDTEVRNCSSDQPDGFDYPVLKINTLEGAMTVAPGDFVIKGVKGEFYPCKPDIFCATYDEVPQAPASSLPPHQQRVLDEKQELDIRITKLDEFITRNPLFGQLPADERARMKRQFDVMFELSSILGERIANFQHP